MTEATSHKLQAASRNLRIGVRDASKAEEVRKADAALRTIDQQLQEAQGLKPKRCDCHCGEEGVVNSEGTRE